MKKISLFMVLVLLIVSCGHVSTHKLIRSSVRLSTVNIFEVKGSGGSGTGFFIDGQLLTAGHVCAFTYPMPLQVTYINSNNKTISEGLYIPKAIDVANDLCLLEPLSPVEETIELSLGKDVNPGDHVWVAGAPLGIYPALTEGYVMGWFDDPGLGGVRVGITAPTTFGNSGSPVFNDNGEVVGMLVSGLIKYEHINFITPVSSIKKFLKSTK